MIKMWQEKTKLIKLKKMLQKFQKKIFSVEVSEKIFSVQYFTVMILILSLYQTSSFHCCRNNVLRIILYLSNEKKSKINKQLSYNKIFEPKIKKSITFDIIQ